MVRGKIQMKQIENATNRQVTFSKRRTGLLKKAHELSVLCDVEVAVIIFSQRGRIYEFSSTEMQKIIERYRKQAKEEQTNKVEVEHYMEQLKVETANITKKIELLEASKRKLLGHDIGSCSYEELQDIDSKLERSLRSIRTRKEQLFREQIDQLKGKERILLEENANLREKSTTGANPWQPLVQEKEVVAYCSSHSSEVETELYIGLPEIRC